MSRYLLCSVQQKAFCAENLSVAFCFLSNNTHSEEGGDGHIVKAARFCVEGVARGAAVNIIKYYTRQS